MSDPIADYLAQLARHLTTDDAQRDAILSEVHAHLDEAVARATATGVPKPEAEAQAVVAFGRIRSVAHRLNAVHPVAWNRARVLRGVAWGVVVTWLVWTLVTYPVLAYLTVTRGYVPGNPPGIFQPLWLDLLFYASPPAFGGVWALRTAPALWLVPLVLLYGAVPFVWGIRARRWWLPGVAFGLGGVLAFPWIVVAWLASWQWQLFDWTPGLSIGSQVSQLHVFAALWLFVPVALVASGLGAVVSALLPNVSAREVMGRGALRWRRVFSARVLGIVALLALVGISVWAGFGAETWALSPQPSPAEELAIAQPRLNFAVHLPTTLPAGMALTSVQDQPLGCASPCPVYYPDNLYLAFSDAAGQTIYLEESVPPATQPITATPPNYKVNHWGGGQEHPVWWLGETDTTFKAVELAWSAQGVTFQLFTYSGFTADQLRTIADSIQ